MADVINAGINLPYVYITGDLDGNPRIIDDMVDMGAYEYVPEPIGTWIMIMITCYFVRNCWNFGLLS